MVVIITCDDDSLTNQTHLCCTYSCHLKTAWQRTKDFYMWLCFHLCSLFPRLHFLLTIVPVFLFCCFVWHIPVLAQVIVCIVNMLLSFIKGSVWCLPLLSSHLFKSGHHPECCAGSQLWHLRLFWWKSSKWVWKTPITDCPASTPVIRGMTDHVALKKICCTIRKQKISSLLM